MQTESPRWFSRWRGDFFDLLRIAGITILILLLLEGALRLAGYPAGLFHYRPLDGSMLLLPSAKYDVLTGPIPYTVETNLHGFRGDDFDYHPGFSKLVACLGDSVTDGFYVDNADTYPALMERAYDYIQTINAGQGESSIDKEVAIYERYVRPHKPDFVALIFVSNDLDELRGLTPETLFSREFFQPDTRTASEWLLFGRTALGELILDAAMRISVPKYGADRAQLLGDRSQRYNIPGGDRFRENAWIFLEQHARPNGGIAYATQWRPEHQALLDLYMLGLERLRALCEEDGAKLEVFYYPDYSEIYLPERPAPLRQRFLDACKERGFNANDMYDTFAQNKHKVLHLAPLDFHPNPAGNQLIAEFVGAYLPIDV